MENIEGARSRTLNAAGAMIEVQGLESALAFGGRCVVNSPSWVTRSRNGTHSRHRNTFCRQLRINLSSLIVFGGQLDELQGQIIGGGLGPTESAPIYAVCTVPFRFMMSRCLLLLLTV